MRILLIGGLVEKEELVNEVNMGQVVNWEENCECGVLKLIEVSVKIIKRGAINCIKCFKVLSKMRREKGESVLFILGFCCFKQRYFNDLVEVKY